MNGFIHVVTLVTTFVVSLNCFSATLITDSSPIPKLLGASDININGILYDVSFQDGSCISLFDGCDELSDFFFQTESDAIDAAQALLDQILIDTSYALYETVPEHVEGCAPSGATVGCSIYTPYTFISGTPVAATARNKYTIVDDIFVTGVSASQDTTGIPAIYAVWSLSSASPVPLPASGWLFISAVGGVFSIRKIKQK